jgi:hypothetical protein
LVSPFVSDESLRFPLLALAHLFIPVPSAAESMCGFLENGDSQAFFIELKTLSAEVTAAPIPFRYLEHLYLPDLSG